MTFKLFKKQIVEETEHNIVDYIPKDCPIETVAPKNNNYFNGIIMNTVFNTVEYVSSSGFMNGVLFNVTFDNCNLRRVNFMNAYLINCKFNECNISNTDFMNCHMINTKFNRCYGCADCMNVITLDTRLPYIVDRMNHKHFVTYLDYVDHIYCPCKHGGRNYITHKIQKYENIVGLNMLVDTHTRYY